MKHTCFSIGVLVAGMAGAMTPASPAVGGPPPTGAIMLPKAWEMSAPLIRPEKRANDQAVSVKDPTVVYHEGRWHVFMTIRCDGWVPIEYVSFERWDQADAAPRKILRLVDSKYYCAPQVFYFRPHKKWYLIYQVALPTRKGLQIGYSTTTDIADPNSWTKAEYFFDKTDPRKVTGLDFWVICDPQRAYLFYTSCNGKMWRMWTKLEDFPKGFDHFQPAIQADVFEASHTYRLKGLDKYLTVIEANPGGRRYYKAYLADRLDGDWTPLADSEAKPFAAASNVRPAAGVQPWSDNISHGELIRDGVDETLTVDPANFKMLFQGATQKGKAGKPYGQIPWRLGLLTPVAR